MSISTKFILKRKSHDLEENHPIMMQIIIDRKNQLVSTKKYSPISCWNEKKEAVNNKHPEHKSINLLLNTVKSKIDLFLISRDNTSPITFEDIKSIVRKYTGGQKQNANTTLFQAFEEHIVYLKKNNRIGYADIFGITLKTLKNFTTGKDKNFLSINAQFLRDFEDYLTQRNCMLTTKSVYFRTFRTLWRIAMRDGYCPKEHYPFKDFSFAKYNNPKTKKRAISTHQIQLIENLQIDPQKDTLINSRNYFLFSYYCRGINFTDVANLKWANVKDNELNYIRCKTKDEFNFKLHPKAIKILRHYKTLKGNSDAGYIFPILYKRHATEESKRDRKKKILKRVNKDINQIAKEVGIEKRITTYVARHSFATALLGKGVSKEDIGKTLQHEDLKTTSIYLDEIDNPYFDDTINALI